MPAIKKIFPGGTAVSPLHTLKIILLAEGYRAVDRPQFAAACSEFVDVLTHTAPFSLTDLHPTTISVHAGFVASAAAGAAVDAPAIDRTAFDARYETASHRLTISQAKVNAFVEDPATTLTFGNEALPLIDILRTGDVSMGATGTIVAVLLPPIAGEAATAEAESALGEEDYYFVACTTNNLWPQVVLRGVGRVMGLGDEWELDGDGFLEPADRRAAAYVNLVYAAEPPTTHDDFHLKWHRYLSVAERIAPPAVHPKADPAVADHGVDPIPLTPSTIGYWEGGGGYRTKIYRSAHDCLMRRRVGDSRLPLSAAPVPFCKVCRLHLANLLF
ncbi:MAG TPA: M64 family metallopeptidase [Vicinamibacterales bacterium]|nr:M64 family metallopeptidase [Vicinamibacterales bacterium]